MVGKLCTQEKSNREITPIEAQLWKAQLKMCEMHNWGHADKWNRGGWESKRGMKQKNPGWWKDPGDVLEQEQLDGDLDHRQDINVRIWEAWKI